MLMAFGLTAAAAATPVLAFGTPAAAAMYESLCRGHGTARLHGARIRRAMVLERPRRGQPFAATSRTAAFPRGTLIIEHQRELVGNADRGGYL